MLIIRCSYFVVREHLLTKLLISQSRLAWTMATYD